MAVELAIFVPLIHRNTQSHADITASSKQLVKSVSCAAFRSFSNKFEKGIVYAWSSLDFNLKQSELEELKLVSLENQLQDQGHPWQTYQILIFEDTSGALSGGAHVSQKMQEDVNKRESRDVMI